jgi:C4-dicarboxylate transporter DctQ subunit
MYKPLKWFDDHFEETILGMLLIIITIIIFFQIIMRYVFSSAMSWPEELSRYCLICSTLISLSYCIKKNIMLRVDIVVGLFPKKVHTVLDTCIDIISLGLYSYLFFYSFEVVKLSYNSMQLSTALRFPMYIIYVWGTLCFGLAVIRTVQRVVLKILKTPKNSKKGDTIL